MPRQENTEVAAIAFDELYIRYKYKFILIAYSYLQDEDVAEDVVTDSFIHFWENRDSLELDASPQAYILGIVKKKCLMHLRSQDIHRKATEAIHKYFQWEIKQNIDVLEDCDLTKQLFSKEVEAIFNAQVKKLPEIARKVFLSSRNEHLTYQEIAAKYNLTQRQVIREMSRALSLLRIALKDYLPVAVIAMLLLKK
ncbi:RNA polymerase sigma-70 factor [uncultured Alistipes sp.]|jgi:RNA polymerase sigma-70 factor|uniref:RNA polymerase sigma-70 factor n=1 Tax=uncultured Alistipes sp. TaxID=538949 RepID=UPI0025F1FF8A|nr:RNA polymerase sigma-70 factor [uncultured Alistipes sp.]